MINFFMLSIVLLFFSGNNAIARTCSFDNVSTVYKHLTDSDDGKLPYPTKYPVSKVLRSFVTIKSYKSLNPIKGCPFAKIVKIEKRTIRRFSLVPKINSIKTYSQPVKILDNYWKGNDNNIKKQNNRYHVQPISSKTSSYYKNMVSYLNVAESKESLNSPKYLLPSEILAKIRGMNLRNDDILDIYDMSNIDYYDLGENSERNCVAIEACKWGCKHTPLSSDILFILYDKLKLSHDLVVSFDKVYKDYLVLTDTRNILNNNLQVIEELLISNGNFKKVEYLKLGEFLNKKYKIKYLLLKNIYKVDANKILKSVIQRLEGDLLYLMQAKTELNLFNEVNANKYVIVNIANELNKLIALYENKTQKHYVLNKKIITQSKYLFDNICYIKEAHE